eukprot:scaffold1727_cov119-Isochrysis_galbana.AAC.1
MPHARHTCISTACPLTMPAAVKLDATLGVASCTLGVASCRRWLVTQSCWAALVGAGTTLHPCKACCSLPCDQRVPFSNLPSFALRNGWPRCWQNKSRS